MSEARFTPGPWSQQREGTPFARNRVWAAPEHGNMPVCSLLSHGSQPADLDPTAQANGRLIAAAPDLYASLRELSALYDSIYTQGLTDAEMRALKEAWGRADAALAKAHPILSPQAEAAQETQPKE